MTTQPITLKTLLETRAELIRKIKSEMTAEEKEFLLSFKKGTPEWNKLGLNNIEPLPAVQWKLINLGRKSVTKREKALEKLIQALS